MRSWIEHEQAPCDGSRRICPPRLSDRLKTRHPKPGFRFLWVRDYLPGREWFPTSYPKASRYPEAVTPRPEGLHLKHAGRDGRALTRALWLLNPMRDNELEDLLAHWLTTNLTPPISESRHFAGEVGQYFGSAAMLITASTGLRRVSTTFTRSLVGAPAVGGLLNAPEAHAFFVSRAVFGAKLQVLNGVVPVDRASDYVSFVTQCGSVLLPRLSENRDGDTPAFWLWVFHPILDELGSDAKLKPGSDDRLKWWRALCDLARSIVRFGSAREISDLFSRLRKSPLLATLAAAASRLAGALRSPISYPHPLPLWERLRWPTPRSR
jgi:hypothetical protein